jgi:hemolysin activation/secretion protein
MLGFNTLASVTQLQAAPVAKLTDFLSDSGAPYERNDPPINFAEDVEDKLNQEQAKQDRTKAAGADTKSEAQAEAQNTNYFDILEFQVEGNTKLTKMQVEAAIYLQMGEKKTITDVEKAREALEKAYHRIGYLTVLVDIPEQDVDKKVVRLNVTEGKIGSLRVRSSKYFTLGRIKELSPSVAEGEVPHFPTLQKDIARLNRTADKQVTPVMKAGKKFGTVDVDLKVEDKLPVHASLDLNNRYSQDTSPLRLSGMIRYDNLWQREHSLSLNFLTSPQNTSEVQVLSANYLMRFDDSNVLLAMYGVKSNSSVSAVGGVGGFNILGKGAILGARLIKPLPSLDNFYHSIAFGADYKDFEQTVQFGKTYDTPVTYMPMSAVYSGTWQDTSGVTQLGAGITFGMRGLVAEEAEFKAKRSNTSTNTYAKSDFFVFKADLSRTQVLPWGLQAFAKVDGQFSGDMLISNEQYLAGGVDTVRGYLEAQAAGDKALRSSLELRTPSLFKSVTWIQDFKLSGFYDVAQLFTIDPSEGQTEKTLLSGTGIGLRMKAWKRFNVNLDMATPLKNYGVINQGDIAGHMRVWYEF